MRVKTDLKSSVLVLVLVQHLWVPNRNVCGLLQQAGGTPKQAAKTKRVSGIPLIRANSLEKSPDSTISSKRVRASPTKQAGKTKRVSGIPIRANSLERSPGSRIPIPIIPKPSRGRKRGFHLPIPEQMVAGAIWRKRWNTIWVKNGVSAISDARKSMHKQSVILINWCTSNPLPGIGVPTISDSRY